MCLVHHFKIKQSTNVQSKEWTQKLTETHKSLRLTNSNISTYFVTWIGKICKTNGEGGKNKSKFHLLISDIYIMGIEIII